MLMMNAAGVIFTNSRTNPVRSWFRRMIDQLEFIVYNADLNWNDAEIKITMSSFTWDCISRIYAYGSYYDANESTNKNVYHTRCTDYVEKRHKEYLSDCALPISGRLYPIVLDDKASDIHFKVYVSGQFNEEFSGCIENVNCYEDHNDNNI
jgi:hypothetical protein